MATIKPVYSKIPQKGTVDYNVLGGKVGIHADRISDIGGHHTGAAAATGTISLSSVDRLAADDAITLTGSTGTVYTLKAHAATTTSTHTTSPTFALANASTTATNIKTAVHALNDFTAVKDTLDVNITQVTVGAAGNTTIVTALSNGDVGATATGFASGKDAGYDESEEAIAALTAGYAEDSADAKVLEHARKRVLGYI